MNTLEMTFRGRDYRIEVYPYSETDAELVWSVFRKNTYGWDKMRLFTKSQIKALPKTVARAAVDFYKQVQAKAEDKQP